MTIKVGDDTDETILNEKIYSMDEYINGFALDRFSE